jgi:hypothetical protein
MQMGPIYDPAQLTHSRLLEFAIMAAWISTVVETGNDSDFDAFVVALSVVQATREASEESLEELVATWLGEDPENRPVLRLTLIDPWKELGGVWSEDAPKWLRAVGTIATTAHVKYDPFRRCHSE